MAHPERACILWNNKISDSDWYTASEEAAGYEDTYLNDDQRTSPWRSSDASGEKTILASFGSAQGMTAIALVGHNYLATSGAFKLSFGTTDSCADGDIPLVMTPNTFIQFFYLIGKRYWKFKATDAALSDGYHEIGEFWMGEYVELDRNPKDPIGPGYSARDHGEASIVTPGGQERSYRTFSQHAFDMEFVKQNQTAFDKLLAWWDDRHRDKPSFLCVEPHDYVLRTGFEGNSDGYWIYTDPTFGSGAASSTKAYEGTYSYAVTRTSGPGNCLANWSISGLQPSTTYYFSAYAWASTASTACIYTTGALTDLSAQYHTGGSSWERLGGTFVTDGAGSTVIVCIAHNSADLNAIYFDAIQVEVGSSVTDFGYTSRNVVFSKIKDFRFSTHDGNFFPGSMRIEEALI